MESFNSVSTANKRDVRRETLKSRTLFNLPVPNSTQTFRRLPSERRDPAALLKVLARHQQMEVIAPHLDPPLAFYRLFDSQHSTALNCMDRSSDSWNQQHSNESVLDRNLCAWNHMVLKYPNLTCKSRSKTWLFRAITSGEMRHTCQSGRQKDQRQIRRTDTASVHRKTPS
jgi:hypothetical protein